MKFGSTTIRLAALAAGLALMTGGAFAASTTIAVQLMDMGSGAPAPTTPQGYAMPGADPGKATMMVMLSQTTVPAGAVTFSVTNASQAMIHEMLVVPVAAPGQPLPYIADRQRVDESKIGSKDEVENVMPGKSGTLTVNLDPGTYLVMCNRAGHFQMGMWTLLTVTQ